MKIRPALSLTPDNRDQGQRLRDLMARTALHRSTEKLVLEALPENLAGNVRFVSYREGELVLQVDNATQASQLRFRQQEVMATLRRNETFQFVWKFRIRVQPARYRIERKSKPMTLSKENARLLKEEAGHTKDKALREVLEKLASHAGKSPD
ncbi:Protein of unknown function [Marinobacter daqiaonensis]|uniref:DUF721 domain-containing protein n=1 Tax=Marinobacter daqiaonensis TaxID=650891 RepID=A0A1I6J3H1_9GAMM|nr:DciA family protein [Marinobacter daqiaonensis]SFR73467.1 Protein of unknown function [Marinobacter daqiaonensis]